MRAAIYMRVGRVEQLEPQHQAEGNMVENMEKVIAAVAGLST